MSRCLPLSRVLYEEYNHLYPETPIPDEIADDLDHVIKALYEKERSALCISGGGIRSATFALGVIQGLAGLGKSAADSVLSKIDYLSTVSGGGYIGSWLSAWALRNGGIQTVVKELRTPTGDKLEPEPKPVSNLRQFSHYLAPKHELLSADTWAFFGMYFRNLLLRLLVLATLFMGILALPRLLVSLIVWLQPAHSAGWIRIIAVVMFFWALGYLALTRPVGKTAPKGWLYTNGAFQVLCLLPMCIVAVALVIGHAWFDITNFTLSSVVLSAAVYAAISSLTYAIRYWRANAHEIRDDVRLGISLASYTLKKQLLEILVASISGALFGALIYGFLGLFKHGASGMFPTMAAPNPLAWTQTYPPQLSDSLAAVYVAFGVPLILLALLLQATVFVGGTGWFNEDFDREWWGRAVAWLIIAGIGWIVVTAFAIYGPFLSVRDLTAFGSVGGGSGLLALLLKGVKTGEKRKAKWAATSTASNKLLGSSVSIFTLCLLVALYLPVAVLIQNKVVRAWLEHENQIARRPDKTLIEVLQGASWSYEKKMPTEERALGSGEKTIKTIERPAIKTDELLALDHLYIIEQTPPQAALLLVIGPILLSLIASQIIPANRFSIHALYRVRLIRSYLRASNPHHDPNPFTGFDPEDNFPMKELQALPRPIQIVNITLNLEREGFLRERQTQPFTASPLHCGSLDLGYRPTANYAGPNGITLGTAAAISGVTANRGMGYHSSAALGFILTLFNLRLGWWLGNPGPAGEETHHLRNPRASLRPLLAEVFGNTNAAHPYVYLSDGGHFEGLGLYEMVLRRCRRIIVIDAGTDKDFTFADLANAIRKIRTDFGIRVRMDRRALYPRSTEKDELDRPKYCATGHIFYSDVDGLDAPDGEFVYIKPVIYGDEPEDIYHYAVTNKAFPHESTGRLSESQFESYRALGEYTVQQICERPEDVNTVEEFIKAAQEYAK